MTGDVRVVDVNAAALDMLVDGDGEDGDGHDGGASLVGRFGGEVFGCENAALPGGCGKTPHCGGCTVRKAVTVAWKTGLPQVQVPATLRVTSHKPRRRVSFLVTTAKVGDNVLMRIDSPGADGRGHAPA